MISIFNPSTLVGALLTIASAVFVAELTDKDALLLLTLATKRSPWFVFGAGTVAFTITTAIISASSYFLVNVFPVAWIKIVGGAIMICYGLWGFAKVTEKEEEIELEREESKLMARSSKSLWPAFLSVVSMLAILDLAGDATEILIVVFVAHFQNVVLVFIGTLSALIAATALETVLGSQLRRLLSLERIRVFSLVVFLFMGTAVIITTVF